MKIKKNKYFKYFEAGISNSEIAKRLKVHKSTVSKAKKQWQDYKAKLEETHKRELLQLNIRHLINKDFQSINDIELNEDNLIILSKVASSKMFKAKALYESLRINIYSKLNNILEDEFYKSLKIKEREYKTILKKIISKNDIDYSSDEVEVLEVLMEKVKNLSKEEIKELNEFKLTKEELKYIKNFEFERGYIISLLNSKEIKELLKEYIFYEG